MEIAKCLVALGGDITNVVPKIDVTPAELCALNAIHGEGAVTEIEVTGAVERSNRDELARLRDPYTGYGRAQDNDGKPVIHGVFPGAGARVPVSFAELELPKSLFRVVPLDEQIESASIDAPKAKKAKQSADVMA